MNNYAQNWIRLGSLLSVCRILRLGDEEDRHALFEDRVFGQVLVANEYIGMTGTGAGLT